MSRLLQKTSLKDSDIQSFLPIEKIEYATVKLKSGAYCKIIEIIPCDFVTSTSEVKNIIAEKFSNLFSNVPCYLHIKSCVKRETSEALLSNLSRLSNANDEHFYDERKKDYINFVKRLTSEDSAKRVFYLIFKYEGARDISEMQIYESLENMVATFAHDLQQGLCAVNPLSFSDNDYVYSILYDYLNPNTSLREDVASRYEILQKDALSFLGTNEYEISPNDIIAPKGLDFTRNPEWYTLDGLYVTHLVVKGASLPDALTTGWLDAFKEYNVDIDFYTMRVDKTKVLNSINASERAKLIASSRKKQEYENSVQTGERLGYYDNLDFIRYELSQKQEYFKMVMILTLRHSSLKQLLLLKNDVKHAFAKNPYNMAFRETYCNASELFLMTLPLMAYKTETNPLFKLNARGMVTSSFKAMLPYCYRECNDDTGVVIGLNANTDALVSVNLFNRQQGFQNANVAILGTSGSGKTYTEMLISSRMHLHGIRTFYLCPLKGHEYKWVCEAGDGTMVNLLPSSSDCINLFDIRKESTLDKLAIEDDFSISAVEKSLLAKKITQIITFFQLCLPTITHKEESALNVELVKMYNAFGITDDNNSIFTKDGEIKKMPIFSDFAKAIENNEVLCEVKEYIDIFISGSWKNLNGQTNVNLYAPLIVVNVDEETIGKQFLPPMMYLGFITLVDLVKSNPSTNDLLITDEVWKIMSSEASGEQIKETAKIIRGYKGGLVTATQDISDFLLNEYGQAVLSASATTIIKRLNGSIYQPNSELYKVCQTLGLDFLTYGGAIADFKENNALLITPTQKLVLNIKTTPTERALFGTDAVTEKVRRYLKEKIGWGKRTLTIKEEDAIMAIKDNIMPSSWMD